MISVRDVMTANPVTIHPEITLDVAIATMQKVGCRQLPVLESDVLIGIITERDIRLAVIAPHEDMDFAHHKELANFATGEFMTPNPRTIAPGASVADAASLLRRLKIGALPVVEAGKLVGILTVSDCLACLSDQLEEIPALLLA